MIESTSPSATLDRLRIDNQTEGNSRTLFIISGHLRLHGCAVSSCAENRGWALVASGPSTLADVLGCTFHGGGGSGLHYCNGASGRVEGCDIRGYSKGEGIGISQTVATSFLVSRTTTRDCQEYVHISLYAPPSWTLGEGNIFTNCTVREGVVVDERRGEGDEEEK